MLSHPEKYIIRTALQKALDTIQSYEEFCEVASDLDTAEWDSDFRKEIIVVLWEALRDLLETLLHKYSLYADYCEVDREIDDKFSASKHPAFAKFSISLMYTAECARHGTDSDCAEHSLDVQSYLSLAPRFKAMMYIIAKKNEDMSAATGLTPEELEVRLEM